MNKRVGRASPQLWKNASTDEQYSRKSTRQIEEPSLKYLDDFRRIDLLSSLKDFCLIMVEI
jgi:hypothetical protein